MATTSAPLVPHFEQRIRRGGQPTGGSSAWFTEMSRQAVPIVAASVITLIVLGGVAMIGPYGHF